MSWQSKLWYSANPKLDSRWNQLLYCIVAANHHSTNRETMGIVFLSVCGGQIFS